MISAFLPGLRELRVPLAAGGIWLFVVWTVLFDVLPKSGTASPIVQAVFDLTGVAGFAYAAALLGFVSFLLGTVIGFMWPDALLRTKWLARVVPTNSAQTTTGLEGLVNRATAGFTSSSRAMDSFVTYVDDGLTARYPAAGWYQGAAAEWLQLDPAKVSLTFDETGVQTADKVRRHAAPIVIERIREAIPETAIRLHALNKDLWGEYDRLKAESDFRLAVSIPLGIAVFVLVGRLSGWCFPFAFTGYQFAAALVVLFIWSGFRKLAEANDAVLQPVVTAVVRSPVLDQIERLLSIEAETDRKIAAATLPTYPGALPPATQPAAI